MNLRMILFCITLVSVHIFAKRDSLLIGPQHNAGGFFIPDSIPQKGVGLIIWFHGGMQSPNHDKGYSAYKPLLGLADTSRYILCSPSAFKGQDWLSPFGLLNSEALLLYLVKQYRVDTSNIMAVGISDGSLAAIRYSIEGRFPLKRRLILSSFPQLYLSQDNMLRAKEIKRGDWHFFQGGKDRLFPYSMVLPYLKNWQKEYPNTQLHFDQEGEHDFSWWHDHYKDQIISLLK